MTKANREPGAPLLLPVLITDYLHTAQGLKWWKALLKVSGHIPRYCVR